MRKASIFHPVSILKSPVRFAAGKGSALVVDVGHSIASITPVVDGFVLRKGMNMSLLGSL